MKTTKLLSCVMLGLSLLAGPALAQSSVSVKGQFITGQSSSVWLGSKVIGLNIYDPQNNKIGDIEQLLVDRNGIIEFVVIGVGGFLGSGQKGRRSAIQIATVGVPAGRKSEQFDDRFEYTRDDFVEHGDGCFQGLP